MKNNIHQIKNHNNPFRPPLLGGGNPSATDYGLRDSMNSGVALVAVLAVLVVLTILAASFSVMMNLELKQSNEQQNSYQLDMLIDAGLEHAKSLLALASDSTGIIDKKTRWLYVKNKTGKIVGRYRILIEDEAAKVNISKARLLTDGKGTSWDTGEVVLPRALGLPPQYAKKIIRYRYGPNWFPGGRGDDDDNNVVLMADGIDNDADGVVDEEDEGINDPSEYVADNLKGDDRKFTTMSETLGILLANRSPGTSPLQKNVQNNIRQKVPRRATIYSVDKIGSPTLKNEKPSDINALTARECQRRLNTANSKKVFEPNSTKRTQLAVNMVDYRDENHVLSTLGSTYGVEAVCFNEVMANDESCTFLMRDGPTCEGMMNAFSFIDNPESDAGAVVSEYWEEYIGVTDGERTHYCASSPYYAAPDFDLLTFDPRFAWRVRPEKGIGDFKYPSEGSTIKFELPKVPGKYGTNPNRAELINYCDNLKTSGKVPQKINGLERWKNNEGSYVCFYHAGLSRADKSYTLLYENLMDKLKAMGLDENGHPDLPDNFFKGTYAMIYDWGVQANNGAGNAIGAFEVISSSGHDFEILSKDITGKTIDIDPGSTDLDLSICFYGWGNCHSECALPKVNTMHIFRSRRPIGNRYFKILVNRSPLGFGSKGFKADTLGVSGKIGGGFTKDEINDESVKYWKYNDGKPVRTDSHGWFSVLLTSGPNIDYKKNIFHKLEYLRMIAPEVTEMYNASATPVSLANWRVICNTGSLASEIGRIKQTAYFDKKLRKSIVDDNPVVHPGSHFNLVNDVELFDYWYGSGNGKWGTTAKEEIPTFQMDAERWGITYEVEKAEMIVNPEKVCMSIILKNENFDENMFDLETVMFLDDKGKKDPKSWHGFFTPIVSAFIDKKNQITTTTVVNPNDPSQLPRRGSRVMVLGLPHSGGIVSLTLKNEYEQICARTVDYGKLEADELGKSSEKIDPTKNTWVKRSKHTISGQDRRALNDAMESRRHEKFFIKNGPYTSIGEMRYITTGRDFERLGGGSSDISKSANALGAIADVMCSSYVRLESAVGNVAESGWKKAVDEVENSTLRSVTCKNGGWKVDLWKGQTLRFITGKLRGEKFPIIGNTKNVIALGDKMAVDVPYSAPNRLPLQPAKGDKFSLGPGYASPFCFTRQGGTKGEWTWKNAINVAQASDLTELNLYIHGLNDAIDTTEFFEENNNSSIDVDVWNYKTSKFDSLCKRKKYGKQDSFNAGKIKKENISSSGDFRIRLTAHDIAEKGLEDIQTESSEAKLDTGPRQTGIAWFNYAVITPVPVPGRVNINTASARLLASLPGITSKLAYNIAEGIDSHGKVKLKPYKQLGELFKVKGMTPNIFERCANLLAVDSSFFTVNVEAETVSSISQHGISDKSSNNDFAPDLTEKIIGSRSKRFIVELDKAMDGYCSISELEQYSP